MIAPWGKAASLLCAFFILVFAISIANEPHFPMLVIAGEDSVGTWVSGVLLVISATISLVLGMRRGWFPWFVFTVFFFVLAADERFMFHERMKEYIIFSYHPSSRWVYELPVMVGAVFGMLIAFLFWRNVRSVSRLLLVVASTLGLASVVIDVLSAGVFWEECCKLIAELLVVMALLKKAGE